MVGSTRAQGEETLRLCSLFPVQVAEVSVTPWFAGGKRDGGHGKDLGATAYARNNVTDCLVSHLQT